MMYPKNTPKIIWLQLGDQDPTELPALEWSEFSDVTWCADKIDESDIEYLREGVVRERIAELEAALERTTADYVSLLDTNAAMDKRLSELKSENERLNAERDPGADYWMRKGLQRAAEIVGTFRAQAIHEKILYSSVKHAILAEIK